MALTAIAIVIAVAVPSSLLIAAVPVVALGVLTAGWVLPKNKLFSEQPAANSLSPSEPKPETPAPSTVTSVFKHYRKMERRRIVAELKANKPMLVAGEEGSGKSVLGAAVVEQLLSEGFTVAFVESATPKQMLMEIAFQLGIDMVSLKGKALTADELKRAIAIYFESNTAILVIDDAHTCGSKFQMWLKFFKLQGVPILLLATNPHKSDVFSNMLRIELTPLPEYAIRELMEQAALEQGINLMPHELAFLSERARGNPMLAQRVVVEEYLRLDIEAGSH